MTIVGTLGARSGPPSTPLKPIAQAFQARLTAEGYSAQDTARVWMAANELVGHHLVRPAGSSLCVALIGKVQSGKTTGIFATMSALADEGVDFFILLTGMKTSLDDQTTDDLYDRLSAAATGGSWSWSPVDIGPNTDVDREAQRVIRHLQANAAARRPRRSLVVLMAIKQNLSTLEAVIDRVKSLAPGLLNGRSVIIDDEADQGSPDRSPRRTPQPSAINAAITRIRGGVPQHTFIPVTATPQALLTQLWQGSVRPSHAVLLNPGANYLGGEDLFGRLAHQFVNEVTAVEALAIQQRDTRIPRSLKTAVACYLLTLALLEETHAGLEPASMLVHPDSDTAVHAHVHAWISGLLARWGAWANRARLPAAASEFAPAARLLAQSCAADMALVGFDTTGPGFDLWVEKAVAIAGSADIEVRIVNEQNKWDMRNWRSNPYWILVGADVLGRGFVVKGLITTYMSRDLPRQPNYDTIQQRARFFGYKRPDEKVLRAWMTEGIANVFSTYVDHEEILWELLQRRAATGEQLDQTLILFERSNPVSPTRPQAIRGAARRRSLSGSWFTQTHLYDPGLQPNETRWRTFVGQLGRAQTYSPQHHAAGSQVTYDSWVVPAVAVEPLLDQWRARDVDAAWLHLIAKALPAAGSVRLVDLTTRNSPQSRTRAINDRSPQGGVADPWAEPELCRINAFFSNPVGTEESKVYDDSVDLTLAFRVVHPLPDAASGRIDVGALAIHRPTPWDFGATIVSGSP